MNERKLRRKIQKRSYSGLEYIREESSPRWQLLARTNLFAEEVPVVGDPEIVGLRRVLLATDTIIGSVLVVTVWSALALPVVLSGDPDVLPPILFSAFVSTAMLSPFLFRAAHALSRFYLRPARRVRRPATPIVDPGDDVYALMERLERELDAMNPAERRKVETRLNSMRKRLRAQREAQNEVDAIEDPYMRSRFGAKSLAKSW